MRLADRLGSGEAVVKTGGEIGIEGGDRVARKAAFALAKSSGAPFHQHESYLPGAYRFDKERLGRSRASAEGVGGEHD